MEDFNLKKYLVENKLTTNSRMLNEVEFEIEGNYKIVIPNTLKVKVTDYDEDTDKDIDTGKTIGVVEFQTSIEDLTSIHGSHYKLDLKPGLEYNVSYPTDGKADYLMKFKFKQVGDKLEVDPTSATAELPAKD
jgi:hypothetical protein